MRPPAVPVRRGPVITHWRNIRAGKSAGTVPSSCHRADRPTDRLTSAAGAWCSADPPGLGPGLSVPVGCWSCTFSARCWSCTSGEIKTRATDRPTDRPTDNNAPPRIPIHLLTHLWFDLRMIIVGSPRLGVISVGLSIMLGLVGNGNSEIMLRSSKTVNFHLLRCLLRAGGEI